ncbi:MAG TPA: hypothetical protein ENK26_05035 [Gammaproteobacteria bacterium]|nr:hypothetical protein [Gammaproteobacteria bacterium]
MEHGLSEQPAAIAGSDTGGNSTVSRSWNTDPCFGASRQDLSDVRAALDCLLGAIRRTPNCPPLHVRRFALLRAQARPDPVLLEGALIDLFIALGYHGIDLKLRMLGLAQPFLDSSSFDFFKTHLYSGFRANDSAIGGLPGSVLSEGYRGAHQLVQTQ